MPIIVTSTIYAPEGPFDPDNPVIGWNNYVTVSNVVAGNPTTGTTPSVEDPDHPAINLANPSTYQYFQQLTSGQDIYLEAIFNGTKSIDYVGLAGHNLGDGQRIVQVYGATANDISTGLPVYSSLTGTYIFEDNQPILIQFAAANYVGIKVTMLNNINHYLRVAVMFIGKLIVCERGVQPSFTPLPYGRKPKVTGNRSENGQFLGRLVIGKTVESACNLAFMSPDWYRAHMDPFVEALETDTFFFAWAPVSYPYEVGYAWTKDDSIPLITHAEGYISITLDMQGITE